MDVTWDALLSRIEANPVEHLGGYSPSLLYPYFAGYEHARRFHSLSEIIGDLSLYQFSRWFNDHAYAGPQGFASFCSLLTNTDDEALQLFFEFRRLARRDIKIVEQASREPENADASMLELIQSETM